MIAVPATFAWLLIAAQSLIFGTAAFALVTRGLASDASIDFRRRLPALWRALTLALLVISPLAFLEMACEMAQTRWWRVMPLVPEIMRETDAGRAWRWRLLAVMVLAIAAWLPIRERTAAIAMLILTAVLMLFGSIAGHAIDFGRLSIAIYWVHQAAAGLWLGALVSLMLGCGADPCQAQWIRAATPKVAALAAASVAILTATGLFAAYQRIGWNLHLLTDAMYGRTLLWKLASFAIVILLAAHNRLRVISHLDEAASRETLLRNVAAEIVLLAVVLGWSAMLANTPPPH